MADFSLSDIMAATSASGGNCYGGNILILLLVFLFAGGFGNGWRNGGDGYGQYATAASQQEILFGQHFQNIDNKIDRIGNGIADATFALNNSIKDGNAAITNSIITEGRGIGTTLADMRLEMASYANAINHNIDNKFASLEKAQMQAQIDAQAQKINELTINQQMAGVVRYPNGMTYNAGTSPFCNNGCNSCCN